MHVNTILYKLLASVMHLKRLDALLDTVQSAFACHRFSVTGLGRALSLPIQERSGIRKVDRLVGNNKLHAEREDIYRIISHQLIGQHSHPWIIVDWSPIPNRTDNLLRAALVCKGRALSVYEEVHPESKLGNLSIHCSFLTRLKHILPQRCKPVIVTDAGFHAPWFNSVTQLGWDYVGRVRGTVTYYSEDERTWKRIKDLHPMATLQEKTLGWVTLSKTTPCEGTLCYYKGLAKGRSKKTKQGKRCQSSDSECIAQSAKEPWVILSSLTGRGIAKRVVKIYKQRMQIEEGFRDLKSSKYGFGFQHAMSKRIFRIENLLLIAMLASFIAWIVGGSAEKENIHYQFQANSIKSRRVLSLFYLGCRVIKKNTSVTLHKITDLIDELSWAQI